MSNRTSFLNEVKEDLQVANKTTRNDMFDEYEPLNCILEHKSLPVLRFSNETAEDAQEICKLARLDLEGLSNADFTDEIRKSFLLIEEDLKIDSPVTENLGASEHIDSTITVEYFIPKGNCSQTVSDENISVNEKIRAQTNIYGEEAPENLYKPLQPLPCTVVELRGISKETTKSVGEKSGLNRSAETKEDLQTKKELFDIHEAVRIEDVSLVKHLLASGVNPNEPDWAGKGDPPILQAALRQNIQIVRALLEGGCDVNAMSVRGETALHMAVSRRPVSLSLIDTLLNAGCDPNTQDKLRGYSPLHCVSGFFNEEPELFLRLVSITNINLKDNRQNTVLHRIAATTNNPHRLKQVLDFGADPSLQNDRGETALSIALERDWEEGAMILITRGTDLNCTNQYQETVLHIAARHDQSRVVATLLQHQVDVNSRDLAGNTALHLAAGRGYVHTVQELLACPQVDLGSYNKDGATPLQCAVESGFIPIVQMLVKAEEADLEAALDLAKQGCRRRSQPEMFQVLTRELERRQIRHHI